MNSDTYQIITDRIVSLLESGTCPWRRPWNKLNTFPGNYASGRTYHGINFLLLCVIGHEVPYYLTFKQVSELGGTVKKGSKGLPITYWQLLKSTRFSATTPYLAPPRSTESNSPPSPTAAA